MLDHRRPAEFHGLSVALLKYAALERRQHLPGGATEQVLERHAQPAHRDRVDVDVAILPVERLEALVDLVEHRASPAGARELVAIGQETALKAGFGGIARPRGTLDQAHLEAAVATQLELVAEARYEEQPAAVVQKGIG